MLVVKVELWPGGDFTRAKYIAHMNIFNKSNLADLSNYGYSVSDSGYEKLGIPYTASTGELRKHNRKQSVWKLIAKVIKASYK